MGFFDFLFGNKKNDVINIRMGSPEEEAREVARLIGGRKENVASDIKISPASKSPIANEVHINAEVANSTLPKMPPQVATTIKIKPDPKEIEQQRQRETERLRQQDKLRQDREEAEKREEERKRQQLIEARRKREKVIREYYYNFVECFIERAEYNIDCRYKAYRDGYRNSRPLSGFTYRGWMNSNFTPYPICPEGAFDLEDWVNECKAESEWDERRSSSNYSSYISRVYRKIDLYLSSYVSAYRLGQLADDEDTLNDAFAQAIEDERENY